MPKVREVLVVCWFVCVCRFFCALLHWLKLARLSLKIACIMSVDKRKVPPKSTVLLSFNLLVENDFKGYSTTQKEG